MLTAICRNDGVAQTGNVDDVHKLVPPVSLRVYGLVYRRIVCRADDEERSLEIALGIASGQPFDAPIAGISLKDIGRLWRDERYPSAMLEQRVYLPLCHGATADNDNRFARELHEQRIGPKAP